MNTQPLNGLIFVFVWVASVTFSGLAQAAEPPTWLRRAPVEDAKYYYYVGSSKDAKTLEEAKEEAYKSAVAEAIREKYGVVTQIENDHYLTDSNSQSLTRVRESSSSVRIRSFEKVDTFTEERDGRHHVATLYRYPKSEVAFEKKRISGLVPATDELPKTIEGSTFATGLVVTSEPTGATVWINDLPLGQTPLNIKGLLPPGPVKVRFDQPYFETEDRAIVLVSGETSEVRALLRPAKARLVFEELPANTEIFVDRQRQNADLREFELIAGKKYRIEARHLDYQPLVFEELVFDRNEAKRISTPLIPKPARLKISTLPSNAQLTIDGREMGQAPYSGSILPGSYDVTVTAEGYSPSILKLEVSPNSKITRIIRLSKGSLSVSKSSDTDHDSTELGKTNSWLIDVGIEGSGPQFTSVETSMTRISVFAKSIGRNGLGYGLGLSAGGGKGQIGRYDISVNEQIGFRLNVNREFNVFGARVEAGAEPGYHFGEMVLKIRGSDKDVSSKGWSQSSISGYLGLNIYPSKEGKLIQVQIGSRAYGDYGSLRGNSTIFFNLSWGGFL